MYLRILHFHISSQKQRFWGPCSRNLFYDGVILIQKCSKYKGSLEADFNAAIFTFTYVTPNADVWQVLALCSEVYEAIALQLLLTAFRHLWVLQSKDIT